MDSFELNKIAGAVIAALLVMVASSTFIEIATSGHGDHDVVGFELPKPEASEGEAHADASGAVGGEAAPAEAGAGFDIDKVVSLVGGADADKGSKLFSQCKACHSNEQGGANKVGPALWGVVGRAKASVDGFNYSSALKDLGGDWDLPALAGFLHAPKEYAKGTKMVYKGFDDEEKLAQMLAYLQSLK